MRELCERRDRGWRIRKPFSSRTQLRYRKPTVRTTDCGVWSAAASSEKLPAQVSRDKAHRDEAHRDKVGQDKIRRDQDKRKRPERPAIAEAPD